ncbi:MAG: thioredoxin domain-containing protein [Patescibacteria group bacterium]
MTEHITEKGFLSSLSPKVSFFIGVGTALVIGLVVGFFVLLGIVLKGNARDTLSARTSNSPSAAAQPAAPSPQPSAPRAINMAPITDTDWVWGDRNAKVSVVEYSDTECPFCKRFHPTMQQLISEYDGKMNWVYRHFPLTSLHPKAPQEAEALECAGEQGGNEAFWNYLDRIFAITPSNNGLDPAELPKIAEYVGLNRTEFENCIRSGRWVQKVSSQAQDAVDAGGSGTPYSVIVAGDKKIPVSGAVPLEQLKSLIDSVL